MPMKFVMLKLDGGELLPFCFPSLDAAQPYRSGCPSHVVSAGRVYIEDGKIVARGTSSSLGISSRAEDSQISYKAIFLMQQTPSSRQEI